MRTFIAALTACTMLSACSQFDVKSDFDPSTDFSMYRTFNLNTNPRVKGDKLASNDFTQRRVYAAIEGNLASKGFRAVAEDSADLEVIAYAGVQERVNVSTYGYSAGPYWGPYYGGYSSTQTVVNRYDEGTLYVDVFDRRTKSLVWKAQGSGVIGEARSPQEREAIINEAVGEILDNFPPGYSY